MQSLGWTIWLNAVLLLKQPKLYWLVINSTPSTPVSKLSWFEDINTYFMDVAILNI